MTLVSEMLRAVITASQPREIRQGDVNQRKGKVVPVWGLWKTCLCHSCRGEGRFSGMFGRRVLIAEFLYLTQRLL